MLTLSLARHNDKTTFYDWKIPVGWLPRFKPVDRVLIPNPGTAKSRMDGVHLSTQNRNTVLRGDVSNGRKVLYINSYGMAEAIRLYEAGKYPINHCWGIYQLARLGYEVTVPEPTPRKGLAKRLTNDLASFQATLGRFGPNDFIYCAHNVLLWAPLLKAVRLQHAKIVGLLFAKEPLPLAKHYDGIIAHTPAALKHITAIAPAVRRAHLSWGMDMEYFQTQPYEPEEFLSCGKTFRDFETLAAAIAMGGHRTRIVHPDPRSLPNMPAEASLIDARDYGKDIYNHLNQHEYPSCSAAVVTTLRDDENRHSVGLTNVLEAMASGRPVIVTRTNALVDEIDVEALNVGLFVEPGSPESLHRAMQKLRDDPELAATMGRNGRQLCEAKFNIEQYSHHLAAFFATLSGNPTR